MIVIKAVVAYSRVLFKSRSITVSEAKLSPQVNLSISEGICHMKLLDLYLQKVPGRPVAGCPEGDS